MMQIVIDIPEEAKKAFDNANKDDMYGCFYDYNSVIGKAIKNGTPYEERKTGKWKEVYAETDYRNGWIEFSCEFCEYQHGLESGQYDWSYGEPIPWKYCPCCGAKMEVDE